MTYGLTNRWTDLNIISTGHGRVWLREEVMSRKHTAVTRDCMLDESLGGKVVS